jgi:hypothetical protein
MINRDREPQQTEVAIPLSVGQLYEVLQRSISLDRPGVSIDDTVTAQEFEWTAQEILKECLELDEDQINAFARAISQNSHVNPRFVGSSVNHVGNYLSSVASLLTVHPATTLDLETREEVLGDAHWYFKTIAGGYEMMKRGEYSAGDANKQFVRRVVGAAAIRLEQLERPYFLQEDVTATAGSLLIGVAALRGAKYISRGQYRRFTAGILDAQEVSLRGKPSDVLLLPPEASTW